jgi:hypothetical protein
MTSDRDREYHRARAQDELDRSHRATHKVAAEAHMRLAAMHMRMAQSAASADQ